MDSLVAAGHGPFAREETVRTALNYVTTLSPAIVLVSFFVAFIAHSIVSARKAPTPDESVHTGPGGRPLPTRMRSSAVVTPAARQFSPRVKLLFKWLSVGVMLTFMVDATANILHVLFKRHQQWWCGQSTVVGLCSALVVSKKMRTVD